MNNFNVYNITFVIFYSEIVS